MKFKKYLSIAAILLFPIITYKSVNTLHDIKNNPLPIAWYGKVEVFGYPIFFIEEYRRESQREFNRLPQTWNEHLQITDNMKFGKEYGLEKEINLAEAQGLLGKKVGDGNKIRWLFP